jgi:hypothetical protein
MWRTRTLGRMALTVRHIMVTSTIADILAIVISYYARKPSALDSFLCYQLTSTLKLLSSKVGPIPSDNTRA